MKKCVFIIPYFGKFPNYFELFLKSCKYNCSFNWLFITDCEYNGIIPENVSFIRIEFNELKEKIQEKFDFDICLPTPYKLCDYKPAYGYIFEDFIKEYQYWGHCDIDTIMGDLSKVLTDNFLQQYEKIFCLGHMVIYKNDYENNRIFMNKINGQSWYKETFKTKKIKIFDETYNNSKNINEIFLFFNKKVFQEDLSVNFKVLPTKFVKTTYNYKTKKFDNDYTKALYIWENGHIYRYYIQNKQLKKEEFLYIHLQERKMRFNKKILNENHFKIVPNKFGIVKFDEINIKNYKKISKRAFNVHFIQNKMKWQIKKYKRIMNNLKEKKNEIKNT